MSRNEDFVCKNLIFKLTFGEINRNSASNYWFEW